MISILSLVEKHLVKQSFYVCPSEKNIVSGLVSFTRRHILYSIYAYLYLYIFMH